MLVLTRKSGQKLIINDNIEVVILETRGDSVKIGVKAPRDVSIYREEIYEEIKKANKVGKDVGVSDVDKAMSMFEVKKSLNNPQVNNFVKVLNKQSPKND